MTDITAAFTAAFGTAPTGVWSAPGRVNLIGEHTDYNGGASLPFAIDRKARIAIRLRDDRTVRLATSFEDGVVTTTVDAAREATGWSAYVLGVVWALVERGHANADVTTGFDAYVDSTVPVGVGVSSSAALEAATAVALDELWQLGVDREELVFVCQLAENVVAGAPTGTLDQSAALLTSADAGILLDFGAGTVKTVPLGFDAADLLVLVIDSTIRHDHTTGGYGQRRAECERAAEAAGVHFLADIPVDRIAEFESRMPEAEFRRLRHIVTDTARTYEVDALVTTGRVREIGPLLTEAHASMRDDFEASVPAIDHAVEAAVAAGALGARLTGGGFGGACIALVDAANADAIAASVTASVTAAGFPTPVIFPVRPSAGAHREE